MSAVVSIVERGPEVRQLRERCGLTQAQLAAAIGTSQQTIDRIERGETQWSRAIAPAIEFLHITLGMRAGTSNEPRARTDDLISDVAVHAQDQIEVYLGGTGGVVIRAVGCTPDGEDQIIVIRPENVDAVVAAMLRVKAEALG